MESLIKRAGKKSIHIAYELGVSQMSVYKWARGESIPTLAVNRVPKLLEILNCTLDELVDAVEETQRQRELAIAAKAENTKQSSN